MSYLRSQVQQLSEWRRLHRASIFVLWMDGLRQWAIPAAIVAFGGDFPVAAVLAAPVLGTGLHSFLGFRTFRYRLVGQELEVQGGAIFRWRRVIPLARIQSVDLVRKLRHRLWGVVEVRIEVAGGKRTEATMPAVSAEDARQLRAHLAPSAKDAPAPTDGPIAHLGPRELVLAGATGGGVAVGALVIGWLQQVVPDEQLESVFQKAADEIGRRGDQGLILAVAGVFLFVLASIFLSVMGTVFVYWDFTLAKGSRGLAVSRGLLEQRRFSIPLKRIQGVRVQQNLVRQLFDLASVKAIVAGFHGRNQEQQETSLLLPIGSRPKCFASVRQILEEAGDVSQAPLEQSPVRALWRRCVYPLLGVFALLALVVGEPGLTLLVIAGGSLGLFACWLSWRVLGFGISERCLQVRSGLVVKSTTILPRNSLQHLQLTCSPLQRVFGLANLRLGIAGAKVTAVDLDRRTAEQTFLKLSVEAASA